MLAVAMTGQLGAGAGFERVIRDDIPPDVELDPREEALLEAAVRLADDVAALEADIAHRGRVVRRRAQSQRPRGSARAPGARSATGGHLCLKFGPGPR